MSKDCYYIYEPMHMCQGGNLKPHKPKEGLLEPIHPLVAIFVMPLLFPRELKFSGKTKIISHL